MGNNPVSGVDPDGRWVYVNKETGEAKEFIGFKDNLKALFSRQWALNVIKDQFPTAIEDVYCYGNRIVGKEWKEGMPLVIDNGPDRKYVVDARTNKYVNLANKNLQREFESLHKKKLNIPGGPYVSPVADDSFPIGVIILLANMTNPLTIVEKGDMKIPIPTMIPVTLQPLNDTEKMIESRREVLAQRRINLYRKYHLIH